MLTKWKRTLLVWVGLLMVPIALFQRNCGDALEKGGVKDLNCTRVERFTHRLGHMLSSTNKVEQGEDE